MPSSYEKAVPSCMQPNAIPQYGTALSGSATHCTTFYTPMKGFGNTKMPINWSHILIIANYNSVGSEKNIKVHLISD